jgi:Flp pilus assembly pilin Flp
MSKIKSAVRSFVREDEGALVTEYGMLIVVVVIGMAAVLVAFRGRVSTWFNTIATNLNTIS